MRLLIEDPVVGMIYYILKCNGNEYKPLAHVF